MTLAQFPKNKLFKNHDTVLMKKLWIFFPEMTLAQFPKSDFFIFRWIFFPKMTLAQFPIFGFFFQDSRIGVKVTQKTLYIIKRVLNVFIDVGGRYWRRNVLVMIFKSCKNIQIMLLRSKFCHQHLGFKKMIR